ncbi:MAG: recombinase [Rhodobacteraceae bacterium]|nr:recombinase [Paracoccaceae bacterium]
MNFEAKKPKHGNNAVIYCRVSSHKQMTKGDGLGSQETRCREFAKHKGYNVDSVFLDDASGGLIDRPGMQSMLAFLRKNRSDPHVVLIDDVSRLARDLVAHITLREEISGASGILESPSIEFGEDSDSILVENLLASVSQHQRQKNGEQTKNRMRARSQNGYWVFQAPIGYRYERTAAHGKILVRDEPHASILQEALEGYASGRFATQVEVKRFLERQPQFPKDLKGVEIRNQRVSDILSRAIYAGYIEVPKWDISLRKGHHEGIISFETHQKIQKRLTSTAYAPARKDINADFPLRGFILCNDCQKPLTACWSKGARKAYPYYLCPTKGCESYGKSIPRAKLEGEFEALLQRLEPSNELYEMSKAMFRDAWDMRLAQANDITKLLKSDIKKIDKQVDQLLDRIVESENTTVITAFEKRITKLERQKIVFAENIASAGNPRHTLQDSFEHALAFLSSPWKIWKNNVLTLKKVVLRLAFSDQIPYCRKQGLRTPKISMPFKALEVLSNGKCEMVHPARFERATP